MSIWDKIRGPQGPPGAMGPVGGSDHRPYVMFGACSACGNKTTEVCRIGRHIWLCTRCELDFVRKLSEIVKFR